VALQHFYSLARADIPEHRYFVLSSCQDSHPVGAKNSGKNIVFVAKAVRTFKHPYHLACSHIEELGIHGRGSPRDENRHPVG